MSALPWIKVFSDLSDHEKSRKLAGLLGDPRAYTHVIDLWFWASQHQPDGDLSSTPDEMIGIGARWYDKPAKFAVALRQAGFLDADGKLHDWNEVQEPHVRRREKERERKAKQRAMSRGQGAGQEDIDGDCHADKAQDKTQESASGHADFPADPPLRVRDLKSSELKELKEPLSGKPDVGPPSEAISVEQPTPRPLIANLPPGRAKHDGAITEVLEYWRLRTEQPLAHIDGPRAKPKRKRVGDCLKRGWTVPRLKLVIDGVANSDFMMGRKPDNPETHILVENVFRNDEKMLGWEEKASSPPPRQQPQRLESTPAEPPSARLKPTPDEVRALYANAPKPDFMKPRPPPANEAPRPESASA